MSGKVFPASLGSRKVFNIEWHVSLMYRLYNFGKNKVLFRLICVQSVNVERGVRQGGILSTVLYLLLVNDFSGLSSSVNNLACINPTLVCDRVSFLQLNSGNSNTTRPIAQS